MLNHIEVLLLDLITKIDDVIGGFKIFGASTSSWFWWLITQFGDKILLISILLCIYWCINKEKAEKITFSVVSSIWFNSILKIFIQRARPYSIEDGKYAHIRKLEGLDGVGKSYSFPSGHSQNTSTLFSSIALHFRNPFTLIFGLAIIILVPISRIYLGVHYPTDTIVGVLLGLGISFLAYFIMSRCYKFRFLIYFGLIALMIPTLFILLITHVSMHILLFDKVQANESIANWVTNNRFFVNYILNMKLETLFMTCGLFSGFVSGVLLENKVINFTNDVPIKNKIVRFIVGAIIITAIYAYTKLVDLVLPLDTLECIWALISYFVIAFTAFGLIPFMFKRKK